MSFPRYPEYKDSGVEWVGTIPSHWSLPRLRHVSRIRNGSDYKSIQSDNGAYPVIGSGGEFARGTDYLFNGESVLLGRKGTVDKPMYVNGPFWTVDTMFYTEIGASAHARFVYYCACNFPYAQLSTNTALPSMAQEDLANLRLPLPDYQEQSVIASFLDHETARIDALIEDQRRLIDLLKEKRRAVITRAVSKGLDPDAPMKDSGVEWLGDVPSHWIRCQLRHVLLEGILNGLYKTEQQKSSEGAPFVQMGEAFANRIFTGGAKDRVSASDRELCNWQLKQGDLLFARRSIVLEGSGRCTLVGNTEEPHIFESSMIRVRVDQNKAVPKFLLFAFESVGMRAQILGKTKTVTISGIDGQQLKGLAIVLPPLEEQKVINNYLEASLTDIEKTEAEAQRSIKLLQERRSALISAAVTGKIDVRNWQSETDAAEPLPMAAEETATYEAREQ